MYLLIFAAFFFLAATLLPKLLPAKVPMFLRTAASAASITAGALLVFSTSYVNVPENHIMVLQRNYMATSLPEGKVMMFDPETTYKGPQPEYLTQGFHFILFVNVLNDTRNVPLVEVKQGEYLLLVAREGQTLPKGDFMAPEWSLPEDEMLKPSVFLANNGFKGTQLTVLRPGRYPIHPDLWHTKTGKALTVNTGEVAVIHSNVQLNDSLDCTPIKSLASASGQMSAALVRKGCKGVWVDALPSGSYYLNELAFTPTIQSTRAMSWNYKGGYIRRELNLKVDEQGGITQDPVDTPVEVKKSYADGAVLVRTKDGWTIPIELRVPYQVYPEHAARVVAGVGSTEAIEDRVITPIVFDITRQIAGQTNAKDLVSKRAEIVDSIEVAVIAEAAKSGVTVQEVRLDEIVLPGELLLPERRSQLATSLSATYAEEKAAAVARASSEEAKAIANNQHVLVTANMNAQAAKRRGEGQRDEMAAVADGQKAQRDVIGAEHAVLLQMFKDFLIVAEKNPEIIKVPVISVASGGEGAAGSLDGMAAVMGGSSNIATFMQMQQSATKKSK